MPGLRGRTDLIDGLLEVWVQFIWNSIVLGQSSPFVGYLQQLVNVRGGTDGPRELEWAPLSEIVAMCLPRSSSLLWQYELLLCILRL